MNTEKELKRMTDEILKFRQFLQEGRKLTHHEYQDLRYHFESLLLELESNFKNGRDPHHPDM
jgi:hypothetical protein